MQPQTNPATAEALEAVIDPVVHKEPPSIIASVFRSIFIESAKGFIGGITGFFLRYFRHFIYCFRYLWSPTLKNKTLSKLDWKENCQQSFELSFLVLVAVIFLIKMEWIPQTSKELMDLYNNDLSQMGAEFLMFVAFALGYIVMVSVSIYAGRLLRLMFSISINKQESDILFTYLNNVMFSIATVMALIIRCTVATSTLQQVEQHTYATGMWGIFFMLYFLFLFVWSLRFGMVHRMSIKKILAFMFIVLVFFTFLYSVGCSVIGSMILGI